MVLMIATFLEGVAERTAFTLSVPRFFAVLLLHPGDLLLKGFIRTLYFLSLTVFTNPFPRLVSDLCFSCDVLGTASSLPCFAAFFCVISLTVHLVCLIHSVVDSRIARLLSFTLSIIFSRFC